MVWLSNTSNDSKEIIKKKTGIIFWHRKQEWKLNGTLIFQYNKIEIWFDSSLEKTKEHSCPHLHTHDSLWKIEDLSPYGMLRTEN